MQYSAVQLILHIYTEAIKGKSQRCIVNCDRFCKIVVKFLINYIFYCFKLSFMKCK